MKLTKGFNHRCSICDAVDTPTIADELLTNYKPGRKFYLDKLDVYCSECLDSINDTRIGLESPDSDEDLLFLTIEDE